jgi:hypothetical protein
VSLHRRPESSVIHLPAVSGKNKNIRDLYRGISEYENGYQCRTNIVKVENGDLLADSHV